MLHWETDTADDRGIPSPPSARCCENIRILKERLAYDANKHFQKRLLQDLRPNESNFDRFVQALPNSRWPMKTQPFHRNVDSVRY